MVVHPKQGWLNINEFRSCWWPIAQSDIEKCKRQLDQGESLDSIELLKIGKSWLPEGCDTTSCRMWTYLLSEFVQQLIRLTIFTCLNSKRFLANCSKQQRIVNHSSYRELPIPFEKLEEIPMDQWFHSTALRPMHAFVSTKCGKDLSAQMYQENYKSIEKVSYEERNPETVN
jgi:hypothetical protein